MQGPGLTSLSWFLGFWLLQPGRRNVDEWRELHLHMVQRSPGVTGGRHIHEGLPRSSPSRGEILCSTCGSKTKHVCINLQYPSGHHTKHTNTQTTNAQTIKRTITQTHKGTNAQTSKLPNFQARTHTHTHTPRSTKAGSWLQPSERTNAFTYLLCMYV